MTDDDLADILDQLIFDLAHGGSQKEIYETLAPCLESSQQRAVFSELCSWIFSTEGVLFTLYQPLLSQRAVAQDQDHMQGIVINDTSCKYRPGLFCI